MKQIATYQDLSGRNGFTISPTDNMKQCLTKENTLARLKDSYIIGLSDYGSKQLIPVDALVVKYDYSYFRIKLTIPAASNVDVYACGRATTQFSGSYVEDLESHIRKNGQSLSATKYTPDGVQWNIELLSGKWTESSFSANGGYFYLVLKCDDQYYLYGDVTIQSILGSSTFGAIDEADYLAQMKPIGTYTLGGWKNTLEKMPTPDIPGEYLEYIENDGADYIQTDYIVGSASGVKLKCAPMFAPSSSIYRAAAGARTGSSTVQTNFLAWFLAQSRIDWNGTQGTKYSYTQGTPIEMSVSNVVNNISTTNPLAVFGANINGKISYVAQFRIYYLEIYGSNGVVLLNLRPFKKADGTIGLLDVASMKFYASVYGDLIGA